MINIFFTHIKEIKVRHAKIKKRDFIYALSRIIPLLSLSRDIFFYAYSKSMSVNYLQVQLNLI